VGGHHDSIDCPGASDKGSGVAALIEITNVIAKRKQAAFALPSSFNEASSYSCIFM
jgi:Zn-dependent M28 family amino/carboxypeptidase